MITFESASIITRYGKGSALTHVEMDHNFCSLLHTCSVETSPNVKVERFVTFSYAPRPMEEDQPSGSAIEKYDDIIFQVHPSAAQVCQMVANEEIPGDLRIKGDLWISGSLHTNTKVWEKTFISQSDIRLKDNVEEKVDCLDIANSIRPVSFDWKEGADSSGHDIGVIAQEVQKVCPEAVQEDEDGMLRVNYTKLVPVLLGAIRELSKKVEELEK